MAHCDEELFKQFISEDSFDTEDEDKENLNISVSAKKTKPTKQQYERIASVYRGKNDYLWLIQLISES